MDRELVFALLVLFVCGPALWVSGAFPGKHESVISGRRCERHCWAWMWLPLSPATAALAVLLGWAIQEPRRSDESLLPAALLVAIVVAAIWIRATIRAVAALLPVTVALPAATVGFFHPRFVLSAELLEALDPQVLNAIEEHERAHARHRDPLRIWLAQIAADLQWPWPAARARLRAWLHALELARDDEARTQGIEGADLAAAVLAVASLNCRRPSEAAHAPLTGDEQALQARVARLLSPLPAETLPAGYDGWLLVPLTAGLLAAFLFGVHFGDAAIQALPGVVLENAQATAWLVRWFFA